MRTISVTGTGTLKAVPDLTRISITLEGTYMDYGETLEKSSEATEQLRNLLESLSFRKSDLKTLSFGVNTEYESYQEMNMYKERFAGYKYIHSMKLDFDSDNDLLGRTLYALANSSLDPRFNISYTVKDSEAAKNELLARAVSDAKHKAEILTEAAGVRLLDIQSIEYSWGDIRFESQPVRPMMAKMARGMNSCEEDCCLDMNITPDDIEVSNSVTVVWEIQ